MNKRGRACYLGIAKNQQLVALKRVAPNIVNEGCTPLRTFHAAYSRTCGTKHVALSVEIETDHLHAGYTCV